MGIKVSETVYNQLEDIRDSGETNMFDYSKVMEIANRKGYTELINWMYDNKKLYGYGIMEGFEIEV